MTTDIAYLDFRHAKVADVELEALGPAYRLHTTPSLDLDELPREVVASAKALINGGRSSLTEAMLERMPAVRVVTRPAVGYDNMDIEAAGRMGVAVCNTPNYGTMDIANHAIALTLSFLRAIPQHTQRLYEDPVGNWRSDVSPLIRRLNTLVYGVVGLGRIGTASALRAKALGMEVRFYDPYRTNGTDLSLGLTRVEDLDELLAGSDVVTIHAPLDAETRMMLNRERLSRIKPGAILINTARGSIVDPDAVLEALRSGRLGGAGLDVLPEEPPSPDLPLLKAWREPNSPLRHRLILTPHSAWHTPSSVHDVRKLSTLTTRQVLETGTSRDIVNREWLDQARFDARSRLA